MDGDTIVILGLDIEIDGIGPRLARIGRYADDDGYLMILGACHLDDTLTDNLDTVHALEVGADEDVTTAVTEFCTTANAAASAS